MEERSLCRSVFIRELFRTGHSRKSSRLKPLPQGRRSCPERQTRELKRNHTMQRNRSITRSPRPAAQAGFSLIEIIIVTALIGGLVAFAASRILAGGDKARYRPSQSMVHTMDAKLPSHQMATDRLPGRPAETGRRSRRQRVVQVAI